MHTIEKFGQSIEVMESAIQRAKIIMVDDILTNKEIPINDRWEFWKEIPRHYKEVNHGMYYLKMGGEGIKVGSGIGRGSEIDLAELLDSHVADLEYISDDDELSLLQQHDYDVAREELLRDNIGYFIFDW